MKVPARAPKDFWRSNLVNAISSGNYQELRVHAATWQHALQRFSDCLPHCRGIGGDPAKEAVVYLQTMK